MERDKYRRFTEWRHDGDPRFRVVKTADGGINLDILRQVIIGMADRDLRSALPEYCTRCTHITLHTGGHCWVCLEESHETQGPTAQEDFSPCGGSPGGIPFTNLGWD
jgi:hypothetical protein